MTPTERAAATQQVVHCLVMARHNLRRLSQGDLAHEVGAVLVAVEPMLRDALRAEREEALRG